MKDQVEVAVIGAGPAGIEAAVSAAAAGAEVLLIDLAPAAGGQYFKQLPNVFQCDDNTSHHADAQRLLKKLSSSGVNFLTDTLVWGIFEGSQPESWCLALNSAHAPTRIHAKTIVLATGAYDRSIPFPGWHLPGVITAGAALTMLKHQRVIPGKKVLLSGTGPLQLAAAAQLVQAGVEVVGVLECSRNLLWRGIPHLPALWGQWARMGEGMGYVRTLLGAGVPYRTGWTVTAARGDEKVNEVSMAKLDGNDRPIAASQTTCQVDALVVGYSLSPGTELARQIGCEMEYNAGCGSFVPQRSHELETSLPGIYVAGDSVGIGGAGMAMIEGRIAGRSAARKTGHSDIQTHEEAADLRARRRELRFARLLDDLFSPPEGLYALATDDTIICRCEQVTLAQLREAFACGTQTVTDVKNITRSGMGSCQGRTCGSLVAHLLSAESGRSLEEVRYTSVRPPVHPLRLAELEEHASQPS